MTKDFRLFGYVKLIKGISKSILYDSWRNTFTYVSNSDFKIAEEINKCSPSELARSFDKSKVDKLICILNDSDYGFYCSTNEKKNFSDLPENYISPSIIETIIIDYGAYFSENVLNTIIKESYKNHTKSLLFRFFTPPEQSVVLSYLKELEQSNFINIELIIPYGSVDLTLLDNQNISKIVFFNSPNNKIEKQSEKSNIGVFYYSETVSVETCGVIDESMFVLDYDHFSLSKNYNSCLYKKISIDSNGYIKNCPSMKHHYGHISDTNIIDVINMPEFKKWWYIKKDDIEVCKNCELRYFCHDCRAFTINGCAMSKPAKCMYNPVKNIWK